MISSIYWYIVLVYIYREIPLIRFATEVRCVSMPARNRFQVCLTYSVSIAAPKARLLMFLVLAHIMSHCIHSKGDRISVGDIPCILQDGADQPSCFNQFPFF